MNTPALLAIVLGASALIATNAATSQPDKPAPSTPSIPKPPTETSLDLTTPDALSLLKAQWRYTEAHIVQVEGKTKAGDAVGTCDIAPHAGAIDFDDSTWDVLQTDDIHHPIGGGKLSFAWFRINFTIPDKVGELPTEGAAVLLDVTIDDYAEVWVEGKLPRKLGQCGGSMIKGFNAPNRVLLAEHAKPGQVIHVAVFGANGPLSDPPANWVWLRSASLKVCPGGDACRPD